MKFFRLLGHGPCHLTTAVPDIGYGNAGYGIQILLPFRIVDENAFTAFQDGNTPKFREVISTGNTWFFAMASISVNPPGNVMTLFTRLTNSSPITVTVRRKMVHIIPPIRSRTFAATVETGKGHQPFVQEAADDDCGGDVQFPVNAWTAVAWVCDPAEMNFPHARRGSGSSPQSGPSLFMVAST